MNMNCLGVTRRDCLQLGLTTLLGGGLATAMRASSGTNKIAPKAKSCILIWMDGGPTHYETFDPKPDAPSENRGDFKAISTKTNGMMISEHMKRLAAISDKLAIVREIYLLVYCREPSAEETAKCVARFEKKNAVRREATEDLMWALLNTPEFAFND